MSLRLLSLVLAGGLLFSACSDDSSGSSSASDASTLDRFLSSYTELVCSKLAPCCAAKGFDGSGNTCRASLSGSLQDRSKFDVARYDPAKGQACLDAIRASPDTCEGGPGPQGDARTVCSEAVPLVGGTKALGEACTENADEECAPVTGAEVECYREPNFNQGQPEKFYCRAERVGKEGDGPCLKTIQGNGWSSSGTSETPLTEGFSCDLASDLYCPSLGEQCKRILKQGEACTFDDRCQQELTCTDGKCTPLPREGEACSFTCASNLYCDDATKACKPQQAEGAPCTSFEQCLGTCSEGKCKGGASGGLDDLLYGLVCGPKK